VSSIFGARREEGERRQVKRGGRVDWRRSRGRSGEREADEREYESQKKRNEYRHCLREIER
jgi:hypothetical protein